MKTFFSEIATLKTAVWRLAIVKNFRCQNSARNSHVSFHCFLKFVSLLVDKQNRELKWTLHCYIICVTPEIERRF